MPAMLRLVCVTRRKRQAFADVFAGAPVDPDAAPERFRLGMENWVVQTALRLAGQADWLEVRLADRVQPGAVNLMHRDEAHWWRGPASAFTVVVRADRPPVYVGDRVVVQNPGQAGGPAVFIPHWPQPGLIPRDPDRGDRLEVLAFLGWPQNLPQSFREPAFAAALAELGVRLELRREAWHDYRHVDAVFALRADSPAMIASKPASKLVNAWLAGVPALLGRESAYRHLGHPGLDYLEVVDAQDVLAAIRQLRERPHRYRELVLAGAQRRPEVDVAAVRQAWLQALSGPLRPHSGEDQRSPWRWSRVAARALRQRQRTRLWKRG